MNSEFGLFTLVSFCYQVSHTYAIYKWYLWAVSILFVGYKSPDYRKSAISNDGSIPSKLRFRIPISGNT